jgi:hypothetical protein
MRIGKNIFLVFTMSVVYTTTAIANDLHCKELMGPLLKIERSPDQVISNRFETILSKIIKIKKKIIFGDQVPNWQDIDYVQDIHKEIQEQFALLSGYSTKQKEAFLHREFAHYYMQSSHYREYYSEQHTVSRHQSFSLAEQENYYYFQLAFEKVNYFIPEPWRLRLPHVNIEDYRNKMIEESEELIKKQSALFETHFESTGYKNYAQIKRLNSRLKNELGEIVDLVREEGIEVGIHRPRNARWWVTRTGLHNQHVTGGSEGYMGIEGRNAIEATSLNKNYDEYSIFDNDLKPKYGLVRPSTDSKIEHHAPDFYGEDIYILDFKKVRNRLTWTPGDSLNRLNNIVYNWRGGQTEEVKSWDLLFIPWKYKELMVPLLHQNISHETPLFGLEEYGQIAAPAQFKRFKMAFPYSGDVPYLEAQVWGPVRMEDIKKFIFTREAPEGEFLKSLQDKGIEIFDGREPTPTKWEPPLESLE